MSDQPYARVGISINVRDAERLATLVPRGTRSEFVRQMISLGLDAVEAAGPGMIGLVISGEIEITGKTRSHSET